MSFLEQLDLSVQTPARSGLSAEQFNRLRSFIYDKTGIFFQDNKQYLLESRLGQRLRALDMGDYSEYLHFVRNGGGYRELPELLNAVTINETFFFRNPAQFEVLENDVLPELVAQRMEDGTRTVRIWSAACSTGDEPYTIALLAKERLQARYPLIRFEIVGTDINTEVLDTAARGAYGKYATRNIPPNYLRKYFTQDGDRYVLNEDVRRMVTFRNVNLMDRGAMLRMRSFDVIMCANVLIYFDTSSKQQVVSALYNGLNAGGYLFVGFSETLYGVTQAFKPVRFTKTIAYKKS